MSETACDSAQDKVISGLIGSTIDDHLLLEFTFETLLKSLLSEP